MKLDFAGWVHDIRNIRHCGLMLLIWIYFDLKAACLEKMKYHYHYQCLIFLEKKKSFVLYNILKIIS